MLLLTGATGLLGHAVVRRLTARGDPRALSGPRPAAARRAARAGAAGDRRPGRSGELAQRAARDRRRRPSGRRRARPAAGHGGGAQRAGGLAAAAGGRARRRAPLRLAGAARRHAAPPDAPAPGEGAGRRGGGGGAAADDDARPTRCSTRRATATCAGWSAWGCCPPCRSWAAGIARTQPLWAEDAADCVLAALEQPPDGHRRLELAGPEILAQRDVVRLVLGAAGRHRRTVPVPLAGAADGPAGRGGAGRPDGAGHLGRGAAAGRGHAQRRAGRPTPRRSASRRRRWERS